MRTFITEFKAICYQSGEMKTWRGPYVEGISFEDAQNWCNENAGHLEVIGQMLTSCELKQDENGDYYADWDNAIDYEEGNWN